MNVLIADDEKNICESLRWLLEQEGHHVETCNSGEEALRIANSQPFDVAFLDVMMGEMSGIEALEQLRRLQPEIKVFMISGQADISTAVQATKLGAYDFLEKPLNPDKVMLEMRKIREQMTVKSRMQELEKLVDLENRMIGESRSIQDLRRAIMQAAPSDGRILIFGENGTGKELVARDIHENSPRKHKPFIQLNCAALPRDLIESELFGYEKGAFTGAVRQKIGLIEAAEGGTLFLDEIGDMAVETQAKLLRVLQENEFYRLGSTKPKKFDVRVLSATNKDLQAEIAAGNFREDLFFRLNVVPITVPPLRERAKDISLLADHFIRLYSLKNGKKEKQFTPAAMAGLLAYHWPGNVRELKNIVERLAIMIPHDHIQEDDIRQALTGLPVQNTGTNQEISAGDVPLKQILQDYEKKVLYESFVRFEGNVSRMAAALDTDRANLHKKLTKYGIKN